MAALRPHSAIGQIVPGKSPSWFRSGALRPSRRVSRPGAHLRAGRASSSARSGGCPSATTIDGQVIDIDLERRRISLSLKPMRITPRSSAGGMADSYDEQNATSSPSFDAETNRESEDSRSSAPMGSSVRRVTPAQDTAQMEVRRRRAAGPRTISRRPVAHRRKDRRWITGQRRPAAPAGKTRRGA